MRVKGTIEGYRHTTKEEGCLFSKLEGIGTCIITPDSPGCPFDDCIYQEETKQKFHRLESKGLTPDDALGRVIRDYHY